MLLKSQTVSCNNAQVVSKELIEASNSSNYRIHLTTKEVEKNPVLKEDYYQVSKMLEKLFVLIPLLPYIQTQFSDAVDQRPGAMDAISTFWSGSTGRRRSVALPPSSLTGPGIPHRPLPKVLRLEGSRPGGSEKPLACACLLGRFDFQLQVREGTSVSPRSCCVPLSHSAGGEADVELASPDRAGAARERAQPGATVPSGRASSRQRLPAPGSGRGGRGGRAPSGRQEVNGKRRRLPPTPQCRSRLLQQQQ